MIYKIILLSFFVVSISACFEDDTNIPLDKVSENPTYHFEYSWSDKRQSSNDFINLFSNYSDSQRPDCDNSTNFREWWACVTTVPGDNTSIESRLKQKGVAPYAIAPVEGKFYFTFSGSPRFEGWNSSAIMKYEDGKVKILYRDTGGFPLDYSSRNFNTMLERGGSPSYARLGDTLYFVGINDVEVTDRQNVYTVDINDDEYFQVNRCMDGLALRCSDEDNPEDKSNPSLAPRVHHGWGVIENKEKNRLEILVRRLTPPDGIRCERISDEDISCYSSEDPRPKPIVNHPDFANMILDISSPRSTRGAIYSITDKASDRVREIENFNGDFVSPAPGRTYPRFPKLLAFKNGRIAPPAFSSGTGLSHTIARFEKNTYVLKDNGMIAKSIADNTNLVNVAKIDSQPLLWQKPVVFGGKLIFVGQDSFRNTREDLVKTEDVIPGESALKDGWEKEIKYFVSEECKRFDPEKSLGNYNYYKEYKGGVMTRKSHKGSILYAMDKKHKVKKHNSFDFDMGPCDAMPIPDHQPVQFMAVKDDILYALANNGKLMATKDADLNTWAEIYDFYGDDYGDNYSLTSEKYKFGGPWFAEYGHGVTLSNWEGTPYLLIGEDGRDAKVWQYEAKHMKYSINLATSIRSKYDPEQADAHAKMVEITFENKGLAYAKNTKMTMFVQQNFRMEPFDNRCKVKRYGKTGTENLSSEYNTRWNTYVCTRHADFMPGEKQTYRFVPRDKEDRTKVYTNDFWTTVSSAASEKSDTDPSNNRAHAEFAWVEDLNR